ncbi:hypothetical protein [Facilibium subflavum]|uniref:hypothetical protein n=1 Tax=Facilibium subflavum TaxID=2219058 RepID=UPI000E654778|nr:hypothetical protein [Facilibium subflavum]
MAQTWEELQKEVAALNKLNDETIERLRKMLQEMQDGKDAGSIEESYQGITLRLQQLLNKLQNNVDTEQSAGDITSRSQPSLHVEQSMGGSTNRSQPGGAAGGTTNRSGVEGEFSQIFNNSTPNNGPSLAQ